MTQESPDRLVFIDVARTYAIFLALLAHAFASTGIFEGLGTNALLIKQFTRMATPMFVFMFGFMVEFVYVRKAESYGLDSLYKRILVRSFQCYLAYSLISFCAVLGGYRSFENFFSSLLFFSDSRFGNILRCYSLILLITPLVIHLRITFGVKFLFVSLLLLVTSYSFTYKFQTVDFGAFNNQLNILLGIGLNDGGPSVYGALSFFLAGMFIASSFTPRKENPGQYSPTFYAKSFLLISVFIIFFGVVIRDNFYEAWVLFSDFTYRKNNSPEYYIIGILGGLLTITFLYFLVGSKTLPKPIRFILPVGTSSLISYTTGNIILNLFSSTARYMSPATFIILFFLLVILITRYIDKIPYYEELTAILNFRKNKPFQQMKL